MGYRKQRTMYQLKFEDPELDGLEVVAKSLPLESFLAVQRLAADADINPDSAEKVVRKLASVLVSWNLEDEDGTPQPCTYKGLSGQEFPFVLTIFRAWMGAIASVPKALPDSSNGGATSLELSIPMEPASASHPS